MELTMADDHWVNSCFAESWLWLNFVSFLGLTLASEISEMVKGGDHKHFQERMEMPRERPGKVSFACGLLAVICGLIGLFCYCLTCCCCCSDPDDLFDEDHRE